MSTLLNGEIIRSLTTKSNVPIVFKGFVKNWPICQWSVEKWTTEFGDREIPFRCLKRDFASDEPCWERRCQVKTMTFKNFVDSLDTSEDWMYFDYKYLHQWFDSNTDLFKVCYCIYFYNYIERIHCKQVWQKFDRFAYIDVLLSFYILHDLLL